MRTMKKITSVLLVLAMLTACLCSCDLIGGKDPGELIAAAEAELRLAPYSINMNIKYESADEGMKAAIEAFSAPVIKTEVDGDDFKITMSFKNDGIKSGLIYTCVDGVLYTELNDGGHVSTSTTEGADMAAITEALGAHAGISTDDFNTVKTQSRGNVSVITCTEIKDEPLDALVSSLTEQLADIEALVNIKDVVLAMQFTDGKYDVTILTCSYVITVGSEVYNLTMTYTSKFNYEAEVEISAPDFK